MSDGNVERFIRHYSQKAKEICSRILGKVHPHMMRRTRATDLYQSGVELALISRILEH
jgi:site-specific recombinase XerD